jgi:hypothetical protein
MSFVPSWLRGVPSVVGSIPRSMVAVARRPAAAPPTQVSWSADDAPVARFTMTAWIVLVEDDLFTISGLTEGAPEGEEVDVQVPADLVATDQRLLIRVGTRVEWSVSRERAIGGRTVTESHLRLDPAVAPSEREAAAIRRHAEELRRRHDEAGAP